MTVHSIHRSQITLLALGTAVFAACSSEVPARIVLVNGQEVEIATDGPDGEALVVFEAGLGEDWTPWDEVASEVAVHTRVFAYSRPGYGASGPITTPRDPARIVTELRILLRSQGYEPPYVPVGHSFGGTYMELFAKSHPDEVLGAVLVDPRHRDFLTSCVAANLAGCGISEATLANQGQAVIEEYHTFPLASEQIEEAGEFGSYPVRVLTATKNEGSVQRQALWQAMGAELAAEAADGEQTLVQGAAHHIQLDRPDVVVSAILAMVPATTPQAAVRRDERSTR